MLKLNELDPSLRRRIQKQIDEEDARKNSQTLFVNTRDNQTGTLKKSGKKRIRQSEKPLMNKLELAALTYLGGQYPIEKLHCQAIRFRLGNGVHYTPDIVLLPDGPLTGMKIIAWECKGPWATDDSIVKLKMAATVWKEIDWNLIWKDDDGEWQIQSILP